MKFYASGKLLLFGEYLVLRGAECLAIPLKYGQSMEINRRADHEISWFAKTNQTTWFEATFSNDLEVIHTSACKEAESLQHLLIFLKSQHKALFSTGINFETHTNFQREWGFGTSSTLVSLLSQWSGVNPYLILENSFGGSGYDVACADADTPVVYTAGNRNIKSVALSEEVTSGLLFVYSGKKQTTGTEINRFKALEINAATIRKMNQIVSDAVHSTEIETWEQAINESEKMLAQILNLPAIKQEKFSDYPFAIKSLGAWGGDFFMATYRSEKDARSYFNNLGYTVQFTYHELIK